MEKTLTLNHYNDPSHGWVKIHINKLKQFGLLDKISSYSYFNKDHVFLEEDCDAVLLINKLKELNIRLRLIPHWTDRQSKIRNYNFFNRSN